MLRGPEADSRANDLQRHFPVERAIDGPISQAHRAAAQSAEASVSRRRIVYVPNSSGVAASPAKSLFSFSSELSLPALADRAGNQARHVVRSRCGTWRRSAVFSSMPHEFLRVDQAVIAWRRYWSSSSTSVTSATVPWISSRRSPGNAHGGARHRSAKSRRDVRGERRAVWVRKRLSGTYGQMRAQLMKSARFAARRDSCSSRPITWRNNPPAHSRA